jgi:hypothetical protein
VLQIFIAIKNPSPQLGLNPCTLGPVASRLTTTLPGRLRLEDNIEDVGSECVDWIHSYNHPSIHSFSFFQRPFAVLHHKDISYCIEVIGITEWCRIGLNSFCLQTVTNQKGHVVTM